MSALAESGRASLEFLVGAVIVCVPLVVTQTVLSSIAQAQFATEAAARHGARQFVQHTRLDDAVSAAGAAVDSAIAEHGLEIPATTALRCRPQGFCLAPGSHVDVRVTVSVPVAVVPFVPLSLAASLPITAHASAQVSDFRGQP